MRMVHYFTVLAVLVAPALLASAATGMLASKSEAHLSVGLVGALLAVAAQTLLILFMIITGRVLRSAMESRPLAPAFLEEANQFFARRKAYPVAVFATLFIVAAAVLGYGQRAFGAPAAVHMLLGLLAIGFNLWALQLGYQTLRHNQTLLDRVASELDRIDRETPEAVVREEELDPATAARRWTLAALVAWMPYLYWVFIEWRGAWSAVHPLVPVATALVSAYALVCAWLSRKGDEEQPSGMG
jgi:hypothetical protein